VKDLCNLSLFAAFTISFCLVSFTIVNLYVILKFHYNKEVVSYAEIKPPKGLAVFLIVLGTGSFFLESFLYVILVYAGKLEVFNGFLPTLSSPYMTYMQTLGLSIMSFGYFLFEWSVIARGKYATSWEMPKNQMLVTWGPYRYVRHPSYTAYFLMFIGFSLVWLNLVAFLPLLGIPGYVTATAVEEELLLRRFGEAYRRYQLRTGKFFPNVWKRNS